jgi:hypothetical protein
MKKKKIALFHYNPLELFPPVMNMINYLGSEGGDDVSIRVYTISAGSRFKKYQPLPDTNVRIYRMGIVTIRKYPIVRFGIYLWHYMYSFINCLFWRPSSIFYIETMSSPVPVLLKKYFFRKASIVAHYHEYVTPVDYSRTSFFYNIHQMEIGIYNQADWISHTNEDRMALYLNDLKRSSQELPVHIMPNFPLRNWAANYSKVKWSGKLPLKLVFAGAVDLNNMYFPEFIAWVEKQEGKCTLDILSNQDPVNIEKYIRANSVKYVSIRKSVSYSDLPQILNQYDVGLILYKGDSENFLFNAPNKLFEYLAVGLDVWFPSNLKGIIPYVQSLQHPMVLPFEFNTLSNISIEEIYEDKSCDFSPTNYYAEDIYKRLKNTLFGTTDLSK